MPPLALVAPVFATAMAGLIPALLLRGRISAGRREALVSFPSTPPDVIANSCVGYALRMAWFWPLFLWGANGMLWPPIVAALCFGLGLGLVYVLRQPMLVFIEDALKSDQPVTLHAFLSRCYGNDSRFRLAAAGLTLFALVGLSICELLALASVLRPALVDNAGLAVAFICVTPVIAALCAMISGHTGAMSSGQFQLGMLYFGVFGSMVFILYIELSSLGFLPPHAAAANLFVAVACAAMLYYRRSRYVDHAPIATGNSIDSRREVPGARLLSRAQKVLNPTISVFMVVAMVLALMALYANGAGAVLGAGAPLPAPNPGPGLELATLALLGLLQPLVDMTNWQKIAALANGRVSGCIASERWPAAFGKAWTLYAVETPLMWVFMAMLGTLAAAATAAPAGAGVMRNIIENLAAQDNVFASGALSLLLIAALMMALSTITPIFSACLCTLYYDIFPAFWSGRALAEGATTQPRVDRRQNVGAVIVLSSAMIAGYWLTVQVLRITVTSELVLLFAFASAQLALVPPVLAGLIRRWKDHPVSPTWALAIIIISAMAGIGVAAIELATGSERWRYLAVPLGLGSGALLFAIARLWTARTSRRSC